MADHPDLAQVIVNFAESLPATIRSDILFFVLIYAVGFIDVTSDNETFMPRLRETLQASAGPAKIGIVIRLIGAFDHVLWRATRLAPLTKSTNQQLAARMPAKYAPMFDKALAAEPLRTKHFERAWKDWSRLRRDVLTPDMLVYYEVALQDSPAQGKAGKDRPDQ